MTRKHDFERCHAGRGALTCVRRDGHRRQHLAYVTRMGETAKVRWRGTGEDAFGLLDMARKLMEDREP